MRAVYYKAPLGRKTCRPKNERVLPHFLAGSLIIGRIPKNDKREPTRVATIQRIPNR